MRLPILFFTLLGASSALVPGMEYEYHYEGHVKIGMPEIKKRVSGGAIKCTVKIQVHDWEDVAIQLKDVEVGEYVGDVDCELCDSLPVNYKPVDGHAKWLQNTFLIHPSREEGNVMEAYHKEEVWLTNVKKSIAHLFLVEPIRNNFGRTSRSGMGISSYGHSSVDEASLFGYCTTDYSMVPLNNTGRTPAVQQHGPVYPHKWTNYEMSRTINFDNCSVSVNTKQASVGNGSTSHWTQFEDVQSRHSVMRHNLTYDGQYFILQNGTNEGHFSVNPFGINNEKIVSVSNQTYHLKSVRRMQEKWKVQTPIRILDTWFMDVFSPFAPDRHSPNWIRYQYINDASYEPFSDELIWTGVNVFNYMDGLRTNLNRALDNAADIVLRGENPPPEHHIGPFNSDSATLTSELEIALRAVRSLNRQNLEKLFDQIYRDTSSKGQLKLRILTDTLSNAGTGGPLSVMLQKILEKKISLQRVASMFLTLSNTWTSSSVVKEFKEFIQSLDLDSAPISASIIWINYARVINKLCVNEDRYKYAIPYQVFGRHHCNDKEASDIVLPFFEEKLMNTDEEWKQVILIHAIGNIGSSRGFDVLTSIVEDARITSSVRVAAVYALTHKRMDPSFRKHVLRTFMSVSENRTENIFVRQACIVATLTWRPPRSWYQTLASDSWRENSNEMSSFIYFILKSYAESSDPEIAEQAEVARFFLPITRPYAPSSRYSFTRLLSVYDPRKDLVTDFDVSSLRAGRHSSSVPRQVFAFLVNAFGGYRFSLAQSSLTYAARDWESLFQNFSALVSNHWGNAEKDQPKRRTKLAFQDVQKRMIMKKSHSRLLVNYYFSMFDDMEILLPVSEDLICKIFGHDWLLFLKELQYEYNTINYTKVLDPVQLSLAVPTELGVPLISRFSLPTFMGGPLSNPSLRCDGGRCISISHLVKAGTVRYDVDTNYRFASKALASVRVLLPWTMKTAVSSIEALKAVNLPAKLTLTVERGSNTWNHNLSVSVRPTITDEFSPVHLHTVPYVFVKHILPLESTKEISVKIISSKGTGEGVEKLHTPINESFFGIEGSWRYEGDFSYPFTWGNAITFMREPNLLPSLFSSPTTRMHEAALITNFGRSSTREIHWSSAMNWNELPNPLKSRNLKGELPTFENRFTLLLNGTETRYYEANVRNDEIESSGTRHKTNLTIEIWRSQLPHFDSNPAGYCLSVSREGPEIRSLDDLRTCFKSDQNSEVEWSGEIRGGSGARACKDNQIASFSGNLKISDERRNNLSTEIDSVCLYDPNDPTVAFRTAPVYDRMKLDISYDEPVPRTLRNVTYHLYDTVRGWTFPHVYFNYIDQEKNPNNTITIRGDRYLSERSWKLEAKIPTETIRFDNFDMPSVIENVVPVEGIAPSPRSEDAPKLLFQSTLSKECTITKNKVIDFDGFPYTYYSEFCDTKAVVDARDPDAPTLKTGIEQENNKFKTMIGFQGLGTTIFVSYSIMWINGVVIGLTDQPTTLVSSSGDILGTGLRTTAFIQVTVPGNFSVKIFEGKVVVTPHENMSGYYGGLCGAYDGEKHLELIGPKRCIYSDPTLFGYAWTTYVGAGCQYSHFKSIKAKVEKFQRNCKIAPLDGL